jgi:hypothetical protein
MGYLFAFKQSFILAWKPYTGRDDIFLKKFMDSGKLLNLHKTVAEVDNISK